MCTCVQERESREKEEREHDQEGGRARALHLALEKGAIAGEAADQT